MLQAATGYPVENVLLQVEKTLEKADDGDDEETGTAAGDSAGSAAVEETSPAAPQGFDLPNTDELQIYAGKGFEGDFSVDMR